MVSIKKITHIREWSNIVPVIKDTARRFPLPFSLIILFSLSAFLLFHDVQLLDEAFLLRCFASMAYGIVALTSLKLFAESKRWSVIKQILAAFIIMLFILYYVWTYPVRFDTTSNLFFSLMLVSCLLFSPYIKSNSTSNSVWYFNYQTGVAVFFSALASLVLGVGISLSFASIDYLFGFDVQHKTYGDIWLLCWTILFPLYILINIAKIFDYEDEHCPFPKGVDFITNYILAPLMLVYMAILYAYFFKIMIQWELPRGNLGWMITIFGTVGITTKLLAYPIRHSGTRLLIWFDRYYYYALIVPTILLFIAIGVRIKDYGLTEHRYAIILLGLWFTTITLLAVFKKNQFNIKAIPISLAALALVASMGPLSAIDLSLQSQINRFDSILKKYQLLNNGQVVKANQNISFVDRKSLSSIADYLTENEYRLKHIKFKFTSLLEQSEDKTLIDKRYGGGKRLFELMGLTYLNRWQVKETTGTKFYYIKQYNLNRQMTDVSHFDYIGSGQIYLNSDNTKYPFKIIHKDKQIEIRTSAKEGVFTVATESKTMNQKVEFNLIQFIQGLKQRNISEMNVDNISEFTLIKKSDNDLFTARIDIEQIQGNIDTNKQLTLQQIKYKLMLKLHDLK